jgi:hypothetical protein
MIWIDQYDNYHFYCQLLLQCTPIDKKRLSSFNLTSIQTTQRKRKIVRNYHLCDSKLLTSKLLEQLVMRPFVACSQVLYLS